MTEGGSEVSCRRGGKLSRTVTEVEFFGVDFGLKEAEVCSQCGAEYLSQEVMEQVEAEVKGRDFFGRERRGKVAKSGNSLVIGIPQEIAKTLKIRRDLPVVIYPSDEKKLVVEIEK